MSESPSVAHDVLKGLEKSGVLKGLETSAEFFCSKTSKWIAHTKFLASLRVLNCTPCERITRLLEHFNGDDCFGSLYLPEGKEAASIDESFAKEFVAKVEQTFEAKKLKHLESAFNNTLHVSGMSALVEAGTLSRAIGILRGSPATKKYTGRLDELRVTADQFCADIGVSAEQAGGASQLDERARRRLEKKIERQRERVAELWKEVLDINTTCEGREKTLVEVRFTSCILCVSGIAQGAVSYFQASQFTAGGLKTFEDNFAGPRVLKIVGIVRIAIGIAQACCAVKADKEIAELMTIYESCDAFSKRVAAMKRLLTDAVDLMLA